MLLSSWALLTMEEKIVSMEEKIIWKGLKKKKSVFCERMTVKNSTLLLVYKQISENASPVHWKEIVRLGAVMITRNQELTHFQFHI